MPVEEEVIQPYLHLFEQGPEIPLMLHPITIPVNFCGPIQMAANVSTISNAHQGTYIYLLMVFLFYLLFCFITRKLLKKIRERLHDLKSW